MVLYKKRRSIAIVVLVPVVLVFLLSLNFRIWSGRHMEGELERLVIQQMDRLEKGNIDEGADENRRLHFYEGVCLFYSGIKVLLLSEMSPVIVLEAIPIRPVVTLRSLWVRMDN